MLHCWSCEWMGDEDWTPATPAGSAADESAAAAVALQGTRQVARETLHG